MLSTTKYKSKIKNPPYLDDLVAWFDPNISLYDLHPEEREVRTVQQGRAVSFTGVTSQLRIVHSANPQLSFEYNQPWTISFWLKISASGTPVDIFSKYNDTGNQKGIRIYTLDGKLRVVLVGALVGAKYIDVAFTNIGGVAWFPARNQWVHISVTYDGSGLASGVSAIFNGSYTPSSKEIFSDTLASTSIVGTDNWRTGKSAANNTFSGSLFDIRIYNAVKSASQLMNIFNGLPELGNLLVRLKLDEQSGSTFYNSCKTASDIALYGQTVGDAAINSGTNFSHITQNIYSDQNNYGYTLSGSVYIPRNFAVSSARGSTGTDAVGNTLQYYRPVRYRITNGGTINFNPDSAPLSKYQSDTFVNPAFPVLPVVPTAYTANDTTFAWGTINDPLYVDRKTGTTSAKEKNFLIYRNEKSLAEKGQILSFIRKKTILIRFAGQSNMQGNNNLASDLAGLGYAATVSGGLVWNNTVTGASNGSFFRTLVASAGGGNTGLGNQVGPDISLITDLVANQANEVFLVKMGIGSTSLNNDGNPYWTPTRTTDVAYPTSNEIFPNLFNTFKVATDYVLNTINRPDAIIIDVWDQGENDCSNSTDISLYQSNLTSLYNKMCEYVASTYFIQRQLSSKQVNLPVGRISINNSKIAFSAINSINRYTYPSESANYTISSDNVHWTTQGQVQSGKDIASIIINNILSQL